jgi:DNA-directed RNA polymerase specialized sigma24 family protein
MGIKSRASENTDPLLHPYLQAEEESEAKHLLEKLIADHAQPLVREIVRSKLPARSMVRTAGGSVQEMDDVCDEVVVQLLGRLRELRYGPDGTAIANFSGYVATVAYNSCTQSLRQSYPERHRLKNRLRYLLNHDERFAQWEDARGVTVCGLVDWQKALPRASQRLDLEEICGELGLAQLTPRGLLDSVFALAGQPLEMERLVSLVAKISGIEERKRSEPRKHEDEKGEGWDRLPDPRVNVALLVERRMHLAALWKEICELRPLQRAALLLNLHDAGGQDMLPLFLLTDVARLSEIAASLDLTMPELHEIWDDLPLDDATIAQRMGLTRQQVINLRKSARERLARRMSKGW